MIIYVLRHGQAEVAAHYANALPGFRRGHGQGNDRLSGRSIDIGFGQGRRRNQSAVYFVLILLQCRNYTV